jgi:DNA (cytosine-5)-methyltransferase 1
MDKECQAKEKRIERRILWRFYEQTKQTDMIKVGTDFSGIGSPEAALKRLNIPHHNVFACDIDKYAKQSFLELNSPDLFYDDITKRDYKEVTQLDLYVAGFPCQSFSIAGQRKGFNETRGTLFFNVAEFIKVNQPKCFILENVKGLLSHDSGKTYQTITDVLTNGGGTLNGQIGMDTIDDGLGYHVYTKVLNTKDYGIPQNRERIFIVGFKYYRDFNFPSKSRLLNKLKDILEQDVNAKYYLSQKMIEGFSNHKERHKEKGIDCEYIKVHSLYPRSSKTGKGGTGHLSKQDGTTYCLDTGNAQAIELIETNYEEINVKQLNPSKESGGVQPYQQNRVYDINGLAPALVSELGGERSHNINTSRIRRLTPLECWRLQGFTDEEFYKAEKVNSDTQLYKQAGNSITVNVMTAILKKIYLS